jgi:hypothetical protein
LGVRKAHSLKEQLQGPLFHQPIRHPALRRVSFFCVQRRRDTEARKGVRAAGMHEEAFSHQHSAISQTGAKNHMFLRDAFVKDPSTSLRISLGGSDAARTAQDVLLRN